MPKKPKHSHLYIKTLIIHICKFIKKCTMMNVNDRMIFLKITLFSSLQCRSSPWTCGTASRPRRRAFPVFQKPLVVSVPHQGQPLCCLTRAWVSFSCFSSLYKQNHIVCILLSLAASVPCVHEIHQYGGELNKMIFKASCNSNVLPF